MACAHSLLFCMTFSKLSMMVEWLRKQASFDLRDGESFIARDFYYQAITFLTNYYRKKQRRRYPTRSSILSFVNPQRNRTIFPFLNGNNPYRPLTNNQPTNASTPPLHNSPSSPQKPILNWWLRCRIQMIYNLNPMLYSYNDRKHYQDESSESSVEEEDQHGKATVGYGRLLPQKQHNNKSPSESEQSSLSEEDEDTRRGYEKEGGRSAQKVEVQVKAGSQSEEEDSSESSIDEIQKRIKKFERDLQSKIQRNKKQTAISQKPTGLPDRPSNIKSASSPPLPKKPQPKSKVPQQAILVKEARPSFQEAHRIQQQQQEQREESLKPLPPQITKNQQEPKDHKQSPKKKSREKKQAQEKKKRTESKGLPKSDVGQVNEGYSKKLHKANEQIEQLSRAMEELRKQNRRLREQLCSKPRLKKASLQVQKLKQISSETNNVKLEKEIQLLKIIEGLQNKLKKSIAKKLNKSRVGSTSAALLHKGLPSSLIN